MNLYNSPDTSIITNQSSSDFKYKNVLLNSLKELEKYDDIDAPEEFKPILNLNGMSGGYYRLLINNIIKAIEDPRYLEVGSWKGSTVCAAMFNNKCKATCIDNWSEWGGPKEDFLANTNTFANTDVEFTFIESDFRNVDYSSLGKFNVYLFDGPHSEQDQYDGIVITQPALDEEFILIVDDWNWQQVRQGTMTALQNLNLKVLESISITFTPHLCCEETRWHNGYFIAVISK